MELLTIKNITGAIAIALTFIAYIPYFRDILNGKTKPHVFSWFISGTVTLIIYALQVSAWAGFWSLVTLTAAIISLCIFILSFKNGSKDIKKIDIIFLVLALFSIPLWLVIDQPIFSIVLLSTIGMMGFAPTVRKSWNKPYSETLSLYTITTFRHSLSILALANYNIITLLVPCTWVVANALFSIMLIIRRRKVNNSALIPDTGPSIN